MEQIPVFRHGRRFAVGQDRQLTSLSRVLLLSLPLLLAACAERQLAVHAARSTHDGDSRLESRPRYKVGKPYRVNGAWYYPREDFDYVETGIASWYGAAFHGRRTANGDVYDMDAMTAAHRTLPMPSAVRVTNLENGRAVELRVNDRGPFIRGRIVDVSRQAARRLGFERQGTAKVRVEILAGASRMMKRAAERGQTGDQVRIASAVRPDVRVENIALPGDATPAVANPVAAGPADMAANAARGRPPPGDRAGQVVLSAAVTRGRPEPAHIYIQAGAFASFDNALKVRDRLHRHHASATLSPFVRQTGTVYRVRIGPFADVATADRILAGVAREMPEARMVVAQ